VREKSGAKREGVIETLQHTATHCATQCNRERNEVRNRGGTSERKRGTNLFDLLFLFKTTYYYTATHCNTLQHTATRCNTLQHAATRCNTLQQREEGERTFLLFLCVFIQICNTLQTLYHTATHYDSVQQCNSATEKR